jgi:hypothetical protein
MLSMMAERGHDGRSQLTTIADKSYYKGEKLSPAKRLVSRLLSPNPRPYQTRVRAVSLIRLTLPMTKDVYVCPAGEQLIYRFTGQQDGKPSDHTGRVPAPIAHQDNARPVKKVMRRWEKEDVLERVQEEGWTPWPAGRPA